MAQVDIRDGQLKLRLSWWEKLFALRRSPTVALRTVTEVHVEPLAFTALRGSRAPGVSVLGILAYGTWRSSALQRDFVAIHGTGPALRVVLDDSAPYAQILASVPNAGKAGRMVVAATGLAERWAEATAPPETSAPPVDLQPTPVVGLSPAGIAGPLMVVAPQPVVPFEPVPPPQPAPAPEPVTPPQPAPALQPVTPPQPAPALQPGASPSPAHDPVPESSLWAVRLRAAGAQPHSPAPQTPVGEAVGTADATTGERRVVGDATATGEANATGDVSPADNG